jgi:hypothetical protein
VVLVNHGQPSFPIIFWASVTKIQFYLQLADLLVGLGDQGLPGFALAFLVNSKQHRCSFHQGPFPGMNLARKQPTSSKETSMTSNHNFKKVHPHLLRYSDVIERTCQLGTPQDPAGTFWLVQPLHGDALPVYPSNRKMSYVLTKR